MNKENHSLPEIRKAASKLLALAVKELFPSVLLVGGNANSLGFYYDFVFPFPFLDSFLEQVEERIQALIRQKKTIEMREMVPFSAKEYFISSGEKWIARQAELSSSSTVFLFQIGEWMDLFDREATIQHTGEAGVVKLLKSEPVGKKEGSQVTRIHGTAFFEKNELKEFLKKMHGWQENSHIFFGKELQLFIGSEEGQSLWMPDGMILKQILESFFEQEMRADGCSFVETEPVIESGHCHELFLRHQQICSYLPHFQNSPVKVSEKIISVETDLEDFSSGLLHTPSSRQIITHVFCSEKQLFDQFISSLLFMTKIFKILDFEFRFVLLGKEKHFSQKNKGGKKSVETLLQALEHLGVPYRREQDVVLKDEIRLEGRVKDALDREWTVSFLRLFNDGVKADRWAYSWSACVSLERWIALILEKSKGDLPFWLAVEQVKILPVRPEQESRADEIAGILRSKGFRIGNEKAGVVLKNRVHLAMKQKVPFLVVIGEKEIEMQKIMLRKRGEGEAVSLTLPDLIELLRSTLNGSYRSEL
jgi:threonyl-tRNA synthetase